MEQGIFQVELAKTLGVNEMTIVNWEIKGIVPAKRHSEKISRTVERCGRWLGK